MQTEAGVIWDEINSDCQLMLRISFLVNKYILLTFQSMINLIKYLFSIKKNEHNLVKKEEQWNKGSCKFVIAVMI